MFVAGLSIEPGQSHFDHLMAGGDTRFSVAEIVIHQFCILQADIQQAVGTGGLIIGGSGFVKVSAVVKFMAENWILQPAFLVDPVMRRRIRMHGPEGIEIAIRFLCGGDACDNCFEFGLEFRVGPDTQAVCGSFHHLVDVGVVKRIDRGGLVLKCGFSGGPALQGCRRRDRNFSGGWNFQAAPWQTGASRCY